MPGRRIALFALLLVAFPIAALAGFATPAAAADSGLTVTVSSDDPAKPSIVLTNNGPDTCQVVAGSPLGTVALTRVEQDGGAIEPLVVDASFDERLDILMAGRLVPLEPGASVAVPLAVAPAGPTGLALEMVTWSEASGTYAALYPVTPDRPLLLELTYSVPIRAEDGARVCLPAMYPAAGGPESAAGRTGTWIWVTAGAAAFALVLVVVIVLVRRRRRRASAAAALLALALLGTIIQDGRPAHATVTNTDPSLQSAFDECMSVLRQPGNDPDGILPALDDEDVDVSVRRPSSPGDTHESALDEDTIFIFWDPDTPRTYHGSGGQADPCSSLYHELHHGWQHNQGIYSMTPCRTSDARGRTLPKTEVLATHAQNRLRERLGLPPRDHYGDIPLPEDCLKPDEPRRCEGASCGDSNGDPHLLTFDNAYYDFQAAGEFVLTRHVAGGFEVQVRQEPVARSRTVAVNTAVAMAVGPDRVEVRLASGDPELVIGGHVVELTSTDLPGGGSVDVVADHVAVSWPEGAEVFVRPIGRWGLHLSVRPAPDFPGALEGLLGDYDGDKGNDIRPRGGEPIAEPTFAALYPSYADSWRIDEASSLFTYLPGTGAETYVDRAFPYEDVSVDDLPNRAAAEALCRRQGVTDPDRLAGCILDVALTGQGDFAAAAASGQAFTGGPDFGGQAFLVRLEREGDVSEFAFNGTAGQRVFVDVPIATLPNACGALGLRGPDGDEIADGCIIGGRGFIDATTLPATGRYTIAVEARRGPGEARLNLITVTDQMGTLAADAPAVPVRIDKPGTVGRFTFTGAAGQPVFIDVPTTTLPNRCGVLELIEDATGERIGDGCVIGGAGRIDRTVLPAGGSYTVLIDPRGSDYGEATMRLRLAVDQTGTITPDGDEVVARIQQPGAIASFTFTAPAGQRVYLEVSRSTLRNQCGLLELVGPDGPVADGCIVGGEGGIERRDGVVLEAAGTYTIILDPYGRNTGDAVLRLHTFRTDGS